VIGDRLELARDALVVDLHLELFVEAVLELGLDPGLVLLHPAHPCRFRW
jgi:hypothetical protein